MDLNYLGSGVQPGASMPAAVPGAGTPTSFLGGAPVRPAGGPPTPGGIPLPPSLLAPPDPSSMQYSAVTQQDGSVLLHIMNPDGSLGPAIQIINPVKPGKGR